jgi:hypothetical protein
LSRNVNISSSTCSTVKSCSVETDASQQRTQNSSCIAEGKTCSLQDNSKPKFENPTPKNGNQKPQLGNLNHKIGDLKPKIGNPTPIHGNPKPKIGEMEEDSGCCTPVQNVPENASSENSLPLKTEAVGDSVFHSNGDDTVCFAKGGEGTHPDAVKHHNSFLSNSNDVREENLCGDPQRNNFLSNSKGVREENLCGDLKAVKVENAGLWLEKHNHGLHACRKHSCSLGSVRFLGCYRVYL